MSPITTCLWFDTQAEEAAKFYVSVFKKSKMGRISRYGKEGFEIHQKPEGSVQTVNFQILGQSFTALNGGPIFKFTEAVSFQVFCKDQKELDYYWTKLTKGGDPNSQVCGWLKDKFGVSWQVVPAVLDKLLTSKDKAASGRTMEALLEMKKLEIKKLQAAYDGPTAKKRRTAARKK